MIAGGLPLSRTPKIRAAFAGRGVAALADKTTEFLSLDALADSSRTELARRLFCAAEWFGDAELEAAAEPWPHAFAEGETGLFPVGEVPVIAAPGREGKTFATIGLAVAYALGLEIVGLRPQLDRTAYIFSAEDDRRQYAKKVRTRVARLGASDRERVLSRVRVFDLEADDLQRLRTLVSVIDREPIATGSHRTLIDALLPIMGREEAPGLIIFETASTLSDAEEDNRAFRVMVRTLKQVARELDCAVVLVHHTSQASMSNLATLELSTADIRGGTALVSNSRQNALLVNLGSDADPYPDGDARTILRRMAFPGDISRVSVLVTLDSSKSMTPHPVFFRWEVNADGVACVATTPAREVQGLSWRALHRRLRGARAEQRQTQRNDERDGKVDQVVEIVRGIEADGIQATARAVSMRAGRSPTWAQPHLDRATDGGRLVRLTERVPRAGEVAVYRLAGPL